jgi:hypothetical protein
LQAPKEEMNEIEQVDYLLYETFRAQVSEIKNSSR